MRIGALVGLAREARIARRFADPVLIGGGGAPGAALALVAVDPAAVDLWVCFGLAGGLDPALNPGDLVLADTVVDGAGRVLPPPDGCLASALGAPRRATCLAGDALIQTAAAKASVFAATGAALVDLETGALAAWTSAAGLPYAVLRAVADPAGFDLPPVAAVPLRAGRPDALAVAANLLRHPGQWPALPSLARASEAAFRALEGAARELESRLRTVR
jgi:adenosylhomocysteine nucleosidase